MNLSFRLADPAGNLTILVTTPIPSDQYSSVAAKLLSLRELKAQQVGFLTAPREDGAIRLEMMGGEFCGNALRSAGMYYATEQGYRRMRKFPVEISGCDNSLMVQANPLTGDVTADMPLPFSMESVSLLGESAKLVRLPGIAHGVIRGERTASEAEIKDALSALCNEWKVPAAGAMFWQFRENTMTPAVYVAGTDSLFFESSCASGSTAVAIVSGLARGDGVHKLPLTQPGGVIQTSTWVQNGHIRRIAIGGTVTLGPLYTLSF